MIMEKRAKDLVSEFDPAAFRLNLWKCMESSGFTRTFKYNNE